MKSHWITLWIMVCLFAVSTGAQTSNNAQRAADETENAPSEVQPGQPGGTYPERMESVVDSMSAELAEIAQASREGKITREQAEYLSLERYYVALARFQLLRTMYAPGPESTPPQPQAKAPTEMSAGILALPPVSCAPDIPGQVIEYLELTPAETPAIQAQVAEQCKQVQPLVEKLEASRRNLMRLKLDGKSDDRQVQAIAAEQSQVVKQLIVANSQLETKLYRMLSAEQQRKVDTLLRESLDGQATLPVAEQ